MACSTKNLKKNDAISVDAFREAVIQWYKENARTLPWRAPFGEKPDPYHEWLSEIMLQQTVVKAVIPYFLKFTELWPTIHDLADAENEAVMKEWAGLGYYARARNLHKCAKIVSTEYKGKFPENEKELQKLPGIGPYTAAAIKSISFGKSSVVMDGNIERAMARIFAHEQPVKETKKQVYEYARYFSHDRSDYPGEYAQGLMDLGASVCTPTSPKCTSCPIQNYCLAYASGAQEKIPVKTRGKDKPVKYGTLYFIENEIGEICFEKRPEKGLLGGMVGIPGSEWNEKEKKQKEEIKNFQINHTFTHFHLILKGVVFFDTNSDYINKNCFWSDPRKYDKIGLPSVFKKAIKQYLKIKG